MLKYIKFLAKVFSKLVSHSVDKASLTAMLALQSTTKNGSYIVPRGPLTWRGYPKFKKFSEKRRREYLYDMLSK